MAVNKGFSPWLLKSILSLLLMDEEYFQRFFPILKAEHFDHEDRNLYTIAQAMWLLSEKYDINPNVEVLYEELFEQRGKNIDLFSTPPSKEELDALKILFLELLELNVPNTKYVIENTTKVLSFLNIQKVLVGNKAAFTDGTLDIEEFASQINEASYFSTPVPLGANLFDDLDKRTDKRISSKVTEGLIELNIPFFRDKLEEGGLPPGSIAFFLAATNGGKSMALIHTAYDAAAQGHNVLYVSAELSEDMIKRRLDSCITGIPIHNVKPQAGYVRGKILGSDHIANIAKRIQVIEVPIGDTKPKELDVVVDRLKKKGFETNLLIVDYADNLIPDRKAEAYRLELAGVYKDLKRVAQKHKLVVWTASQMNDAGTEASEKANGVLTVRHVNESRQKIHICDVSIGIARTQEEKDNNMARLVLIKNRLGSGDGTMVNVNTRFDISRLFGSDSDVALADKAALNKPISGLGFVGEEDEDDAIKPKNKTVRKKGSTRKQLLEMDDE